MKKGTKVRVQSEHPHHPNRIGYFQFAGEGPSAGVRVFAEQKDATYPRTLFGVWHDEFEVVQD